MSIKDKIKSFFYEAACCQAPFFAYDMGYSLSRQSS